MKLMRHLTAVKTCDGYRLHIDYSTPSGWTYTITWPVPLQQPPEEIEQFISSKNLKESMARSLRRWCYSGYSLYENGFFMGREDGSELNYVDAYEKSRQSAYVGLSPLDFYLISTRNRPVPASLKEPVTVIQEYLDDMRATPREEKMLWHWVYEGNSLSHNPDNKKMHFISWLRYRDEIGEYVWDVEDLADTDDVLPF